MFETSHACSHPGCVVTGHTTGIVFDSGDEVSYTIPIYEGYTLPAMPKFRAQLQVVNEASGSDTQPGNVDEVCSCNQVQSLKKKLATANEDNRIKGTTWGNKKAA